MFAQDTDLTKLDEPAIASLGIGRKFQKPTVFEPHTVWDNLLLALAGDRGTRFMHVRPSDGREKSAGSNAILETTRLTDHRYRRARRPVARTEAMAGDRHAAGAGAAVAAGR